MPTYTDVAPLDHIQPGCASRFVVGSTPIAVFSVGQRYRAISDMCLRCGTSLASGTLLDMTVHCAGCQWRYDLQTGEVIGVHGLKIEIFPAEGDNGRLRVATPSGLAGETLR